MSEILTGIDVGSSNVCCVIGEETGKEKLNILGYSQISCNGLRSGVVVNIEETVLAIRQAIEEAEDKAGVSVRTAYVGIKGNHIQSFKHQGAIGISGSDKEITVEDIRQVMESAKAIRIPAETEIIHTLAQEFIVDGQRGVYDPLGMEATHLGVRVHIVTGSMAAINNIVKCMNRAGVEVNEVVLSMLANSKVVLSQEEKDLGCVLVDFGGQTVDLSIFSEGGMQDIFELQIGGDFITRDIAYIFRTSLAEAGRLKETYGVAMKKLIQEDEELKVMSVDKRKERSIKRTELAEVVEQRIIEIFTQIRQSVEKSGQKDLIPAGLVFTGGSALLGGIMEMSENFFDGLPARLGYPQGIEGPDAVISSPVYTAACGLLRYAVKSDMPALNRKIKRSKRVSPFVKLKDWINKIF